MPKVTKINHIALAVNDIPEALTFWRDALGLELSHIENVPEQKAEVAFIPAGDSEIELVRPTENDTGVAKFLEKRGPGMHHLCLEVDDIVGMLARLKEHGIELINEEPLEGSGGKKLAFVHPKSTNGVLVELYQLP
jgi:methylmalonyl-CoA/ethylmalonyl-CoA epimerase